MIRGEEENRGRGGTRSSFLDEEREPVEGFIATSLRAATWLLDRETEMEEDRVRITDDTSTPSISNRETSNSVSEVSI